MTKLKLKAIEAYWNDQLMLRKPDDNVVNEYADKMQDRQDPETKAVLKAVKFPPLILGTCPKPELIGSKKYDGPSANEKLLCIVDGIHRFSAAKKAKIEELDVELRTYDSLPALLADMVKLNSGHGVHIKDSDRDKRIKLLAICGMTYRDIAPIVNLHWTTVGKVIKDQIKERVTGEGTRGPKEKSHTVEVVSGKSLMTRLAVVAKTLNGSRSRAAVLDFLLPADKDDKIFANKEGLKIVDEALEGLTALKDDIEKELKEAK